MIAGFEWPTSGEVLIKGRLMGRTPPYLRPVNTVFQSYALFQHMTVYQNVAFGLEMEGCSRQETHRRVGEALAMVQMTGMEQRKPRQLSGGQQQRIALARALVKHPAVLLLDEPLGALDQKLRKDMQLELKSLQMRVGITFIYVTHDQEEALTMSDRLAVMDRGQVLQVGSPVEIYERPNCRFVADFIGETNFLSGVVTAIDGNYAWLRLSTEGQEFGQEVFGLRQGELRVGQQAVLSVRPEKISLVSERNGKHANWVPIEIINTAYIGSDTRIAVSIAAGGQARSILNVWEQNRISSLSEVLHYPTGQSMWATWIAENALVLPQE
jgi:spermidine/putrescine transport system ATP-binding protein